MKALVLKQSSGQLQTPNWMQLVYRLLFLDYDIANKILMTNSDGIGDYIELNNISLGINEFTDSHLQYNDIIFYPEDNQKNNNVVYAYLNYYYQPNL